jgi:Replication-relaxation
MNLNPASPSLRILNALNLEKHLTGHQLARLLYPHEYERNVKNKAYQRVMKTLKALQNDGLLKSKSYGLGVDMLWCLRKHKILAELGLDYPRFEVHRFKYEHEKACGDVFVSLALSNQLYEWEGEGDQKSGFRHDRKFSMLGATWYLEHEEGNHVQKILREKLMRYMELWRQTRQPFGVLFTVKEANTYELLLSLFNELQIPAAYCVTLHSSFTLNPLNAEIASRTFRKTFSNHAYNQATTA